MISLTLKDTRFAGKVNIFRLQEFRLTMSSFPEKTALVPPGTVPVYCGYILCISLNHPEQSLALPRMSTFFPQSFPQLLWITGAPTRVLGLKG
jgi:hypothetical protein